MSPMQRTGRWIGDHLVMAVALLVLVYMFLPIAFVVLMSFNQPKSRLSYSFNEFTWSNWLHPCSSAGMCSSVVTSIQIGFLATLGKAFVEVGTTRRRRTLAEPPAATDNL